MVLGRLVYIQTILGQNGKKVKILKFRTMRKEAHKDYEYLIRTRGLDRFGKIIDDPRITIPGKLLRKTWIDESPQLINKLRGDFEWIGIRGKPPECWEVYEDDFQRIALKRRPALIDVKYSGNPKNFEEGRRIEERYVTEIENCSSIDEIMKVKIKYMNNFLRNVFQNGVRSR